MKELNAFMGDKSCRVCNMKILSLQYHLKRRIQNAVKHLRLIFLRKQPVAVRR